MGLSGGERWAIHSAGGQSSLNQQTSESRNSRFDKSPANEGHQSQPSHCRFGLFCYGVVCQIATILGREILDYRLAGIGHTRFERVGAMGGFSCCKKDENRLGVARSGRQRIDFHFFHRFFNLALESIAAAQLSNFIFFS